MKFLLLCGASSDSGCWLKTQYLGKSLQKAGHEVEYLRPVLSKPFMLDYVLSLFKNTLMSLFKSCDVVVGIKAYPNVTVPMLIRKSFGAFTVLDLDDLDYAYRDGVVSTVSKFVQTPFPKMFDMVTYHNDNLRNHAISDFKVDPSKLYRLDQGVDLEVFNSDMAFNREDLAQLYGLDGYRILVYTAHLNVASDLDDILKAFRLVRDGREDVKLVVAGGGPMLEEFKVLSKNLGLGNSVLFTGYLDKKEVAKFTNIADACVVFYKNRKANLFRTSMKLRENLAMGKVVVCNDIGDLKNFDKYTYQSATDIASFASKISEVLDGKTDDRSSAAVNYIKNSYSWDLIGSKFANKLAGYVQKI